MPPEDKDLAFLGDIVDSGRRIKEFIGELDEAGFRLDSKTQSAVIRQQEITGEAVKQLSRKFRNAHTVIP